MDSFITRIKTNLNGVLQMTQIIDGIMMTGDDRANQIIVELHRDREPYEIPTGTKIVGYFMRSDGVTLEIEGSIVETNQAMVVVPALAYQVPGVLSIAIRMFVDPSQEEQRGYYASDTNDFVIVTDPSITEGPNGERISIRTTTVYGNKIVIAAASCFVQITETDTIIEPGHLIPDVQDVINKLAELDALYLSLTESETGRVAAEATRSNNEETRQSEEEERQYNESVRLSNEQTRDTAESTRATNERGRQQNETTRQDNEYLRSRNETTRQSNESTRQSNETTRQSNESTRKSNENTRESNEYNRRQAEQSRQQAEQARQQAEQARQTSISAIDNMSVSASALPYNANPSASISNVDGHKHITFGLVPGHPFAISRTFPSVADMRAYTGSDVKMYDFVIIASNVDDPDNAKLYMKGTGTTWAFITDLSGAAGIQGPQGNTGNGIASATVGSDYKLNLTFTDGTTYTSGSIRGAKGDKGDKGESGAGGIDLTYDSTLESLTVEIG